MKPNSIKRVSVESIFNLRCIVKNRAAEEIIIKTVERYPNVTAVRGIDFVPIDLYESDATKFIMTSDGIRPPLNSIAGLGNVASLNIQNAARKEGKFMSVEEMKIRAGIGKGAVELLQKAGCLKGMTLSNQMSLFTF